MKRFNLLAVCAGACLCASALSLTGCSGESKADISLQAAGNRTDPDRFEIDHPEQFAVASVETRRLADQLEANAVVASDVNLTVHVTSLSGGKVVDIRAKLGDTVGKGQVLLVIRSQDLEQAISDYLKFEADERLARRSLERAELLYSHGAVAEKDLQQAQDGEDKARIDLNSSAERIRMLGGDLGNLSPIIEVKSPISGTIVEQNTTGGEGVKSLDNSPNLFTVADLERVWILCDVYENNLSQVRLGDEADVTLAAFPEHPIKGKVGNISGVLDPSTRTAKVRIELANRGGLMRPGMFATVKFISQRRQTRATVPSTAILRLRNKDWVFLRQDSRTYRRMEVQAGSTLAGGESVVLAGLRPGDAVIRDALQFSNTVEQQK